MFKLVILTCAVFVATVTANEHHWRLPSIIHRLPAEEAINSSIDTYTSYIDDIDNFHEKLAEDVTSQSQNINAELRNHFASIVHDTNVWYAKNGTGRINDIDVSHCKRFYDDFTTATMFNGTATIALTNATSCVEKKVHRILRKMKNINSTIAKELMRVYKIQEKAKQCSHNVSDKDSAVRSMECYHRTKVQVIRGASETITRSLTDVAKLKSKVESFETNAVKCRTKSGLVDFFNEWAEIPNETAKCIEEKLKL